MFAGKAHCPALRFILLARRFDLDAHIVEENVMDVGLDDRALETNLQGRKGAFCSEVC